MIDTLATFADQVTTVAREVGVEGRLGGQASVPGAAGTWKDLTDNVNQLGGESDDAGARYRRGGHGRDERRSYAIHSVEARGEVSRLKDNINEMIRNLRTTRAQQRTRLAENESRQIQPHVARTKDLLTVGRLILSELAPW